MKKLWKLREWLTVTEAAQRLTQSLGEDVVEADIYRLALDGYIKLSLNFINTAKAHRGLIVPFDEADCTEIVSPVDGVTPLLLPNGVVNLDSDGHPQTLMKFESQVVMLYGVYDLRIHDGAKHWLEHKYQGLTDGPDVDLWSLNGTFVECDGFVYQLLDCFDPKRDGMTGYFPAAEVPSNAALVVRISALTDFESGLRDKGGDSTQLHTNAKNKLLMIIYGMAVAKPYCYDPGAKRGEAATVIASATDAAGCSVTDDTIRNYLKEASNLVRKPNSVSR